MTTATVAGPVARPPVRADAVRLANRLAERITGRTYLSHSQISLMRACPRKFSFSYVERASRDFIPSSLIFGGSIHAALELYFRARLEGLAVTHGAMLSAYHDAWQRQLRDGDGVPVRFNKGQDIDTLHALADRMLSAFSSSPLAQPKGTILGVEEELRIVLDPELPDVLARVDLVSMSDTAVYVTDFKTSRSRWNDQKAREFGDQLLLYGATAASMARYIGLPIRLAFAIITKARTPVVQILPVPTAAERMTAMTESLAGVWEAIQTGNFYPAPSPMSCSTCPFRTRCPATRG
jgi:putative RecB family exonuclease